MASALAMTMVPPDLSAGFCPGETTPFTGQTQSPPADGLSRSARRACYDHGVRGRPGSIRDKEGHMEALSRRSLLALGVGAASLMLDLPLLARRPGAAAAEDPLARLVAGNKRFVAAKLTHPNQGGSRRTALAKGQQPFASIMGCADSRVPPEV